MLAAAQEASNADGMVRLYSYGADKAWLYDDPWPDDVSEDEYISAIMPLDETPADDWVEVPVSAAMALPHEDGRVYRHKGAKWPRYCVWGYGCWVQVRPLDRWFDTAMQDGVARMVLE